MIQPLRRTGWLAEALSGVTVPLLEEFEPDGIVAALLPALHELGYAGAVLLAEEPQTALPAHLLLQRAHVSPALWESLAGRIPQGEQPIPVSTERPRAFAQSFDAGRPVLLPSYLEPARALFPSVPAAALRKGLERLGIRQSIVAALSGRGEAQGALIVFGAGWSSADIGAFDRLAGHLGIALDNARLHLEVLARASSLRVLLDSTAEALLAFDAEGGRIRDCNPAAETLLGFRREELLGLALDDLTIPANIARSVRVSLRRKDGSRFPARVTLRQAPVSAGRPGVLAIDGELEPRPLASAGAVSGNVASDSSEQEREEGTHFQAALLESLHDAVVATDAAGRVIFWNSGAERLFGWSRDEVLGRPPRYLSDFTSRESSAEEWLGHRRDGSPVWIETVQTPLVSDGLAAGTLLISRDVSARYEAQLAVEMANDVLRHTNQQLQSLRQATEQRAEALTNLAGLNRLVLIGSSPDLVLEDCAQRLLKHGLADAVVFALIEEAAGDVVFTVAPRHARMSAALRQLHGVRLPLADSPSVQALAAESRPCVVDSQAAATLPNVLRWLRRGRFEQAVLLPLAAMGEYLGLIAVARRQVHAAPVDDLPILQMFADHVALALRNARGVAALAQMREDAIFRLAAACEARDPDTGLHLRNIRRYVQALTNEMRLDQHTRDELALAAVLHDVGKIRTPEMILLKPAKLLPEEYEVVKLHTIQGDEILAGPSFYGTARDIARHHHERWDGSGYPDRQEGRAIPLAARITAVADVFDALTMKRVYKPAWTVEAAGEEILRGAGSQFDPAIVEAFQPLWLRGDFRLPPLAAAVQSEA